MSLTPKIWAFLCSCLLFCLIMLVAYIIRKCFKRRTSGDLNETSPSHVSVTFPIEDHMILQGTAISSPCEEYDASRDLPPSYTELFGEFDDGDCIHSVQNMKTHIKITQE